MIRLAVLEPYETATRVAPYVNRGVTAVTVGSGGGGLIAAVGATAGQGVGAGTAVRVSTSPAAAPTLCRPARQQSPLGDYEGVEVKSGGARLSANQRAFDNEIASGAAAAATVDGVPIQIVSTGLVRVVC